MQWPNIVQFIKAGKMKGGGQNRDAQCSIQPRCHFYICGHMIQEDFYYKMISQPPLTLSLTEAYTTTTRILEKQLTSKPSRAIIYKPHKH